MGCDPFAKVTYQILCISIKYLHYKSEQQPHHSYEVAGTSFYGWGQVQFVFIIVCCKGNAKCHFSPLFDFCAVSLRLKRLSLESLQKARAISSYGRLNKNYDINSEDKSKNRVAFLMTLSNLEF